MQMSKCDLATGGQTTKFCVSRDKATGHLGDAVCEAGCGVGGCVGRWGESGGRVLEGEGLGWTSVLS